MADELVEVPVVVPAAADAPIAVEQVEVEVNPDIKNLETLNRRVVLVPKLREYEKSRDEIEKALDSLSAELQELHFWHFKKKKELNKTIKEKEDKLDVVRAGISKIGRLDFEIADNILIGMDSAYVGPYMAAKYDEAILENRPPEFLHAILVDDSSVEVSVEEVKVKDVDANDEVNPEIVADAKTKMQ